MQNIPQIHRYTGPGKNDKDYLKTTKISSMLVPTTMAEATGPIAKWCLRTRQSLNIHWCVYIHTYRPIGHLEADTKLYFQELRFFKEQDYFGGKNTFEQDQDYDDNDDDVDEEEDENGNENEDGKNEDGGYYEEDGNEEEEEDHKQEEEQGEEDDDEEKDAYNKDDRDDRDILIKTSLADMCWFTLQQQLRSYQDGYHLGTVRTHGALTGISSHQHHDLIPHSVTLSCH